MLSIGVLGVGELTEKVVIGLRHGGFTGRVLLSPRNQARAEQLGRVWACMATLGDAIATPGTFTAAGLELLRDKCAAQAWTAACDDVLERLQKKL